MPVRSRLLLPLAAFSGVSFALMGLAYRLGQPRGTYATHILLVCSLLGAMVFGLRSLRCSWRTVPAIVVVLGLLAGVSQYGVILLIQRAMTLGPMSAVWCAAMLGFIPTVIYSYIFLGERMGLHHYAAMAAAIGCIIAASLGQAGDPLPGGPSSGEKAVVFGLLLLAMLVVSGVVNTALKHLSTRTCDAVRTYTDGYGEIYLLFLYVSIAGCIAVHLLVTGGYTAPLGDMLSLGLLAGVGSVGGLASMSIATRASAAAVFPVSGVASIVATAFIGAVWFGEQVDACWLASMGLGVATVVLASFQSKRTSPACAPAR